ncbi:MAG: hypothetical protein EXQ48_02485 [Acidobacteria bacterium]|nr:hypothetical protein [Acidobacteriota bacterium]
MSADAPLQMPTAADIFGSTSSHLGRHAVNADRIAPALGGRGVRGRDVLAAIFDACTGLLELRALPSRERTFLSPTDVAAIEHFAIAHRHEHVFFGVATRRDASSGDLANCVQLGALFVDLDCHGDETTLADAHARLTAFVSPPSCVIASGGGLHAYWLLKEPADVQTEAVALRQTLRALAYTLDGDLVAAECARILRLPGSTNHKYDPPRSVTVAAFNPSRRYDLSEFDWLPGVPDTAVGAAASASITLAEPVRKGGRNAALYRTGRGLKARLAPETLIAATLQHLNSTFQPPLDAGELDAVIRQVLTQADRTDFVPDVEIEATAPTDSTRRAVLTRLSDIEAQEIEYIWPGRIARGRLNLLIGDPGLGKSFVSLDIAARVTRGAPWPDGGLAPSGDVIVLSAEDNAADTIRPRADALGADVARIHVLSAVRTGDAAEKDAPFSLVSDLPLLEAAIVATGAIVVHIDPVSAYFGTKLDSYKDPHVRAVFGPLAALAERRHVAIVGIMHLSKGADRAAIYRALGSIAFVAAARLVLAVAPHPEDDERRVLLPVKSNICAPAATLAYRLTDGKLTWDADPVLSVTADQLLSSRALDRQEHREADTWLREILGDGPTLSKEIEAAAEQAGIARRTLFRAKGRLRVEAERVGGATRGAGKWYWSLPGVERARTDLTLIKGASVDVAPLIENPPNTGDLTGSPINRATPDTVAPLTDAAPVDDAPAWVTDSAEPNYSDPIGAHDEEVL